MAMRIFLSGVLVLIGLVAAPGGVANADPAAPTPGPAATSTDDELVDMVLDAVQQDDPVPTPAPAPPD